MIAVKGLYRAGEVEFLEPPPALAQTPVIVVFLDPERAGIGLPPTVEQLDDMDWGEPMDAEGAQMLVALHEELAPYRIEANQAWDRDVQEGVWIDKEWLKSAGLGDRLNVLVQPGEIRILPAKGAPKQTGTASGWAVFQTLGDDAAPGQLPNAAAEHDRHLYGKQPS